MMNRVWRVVSLVAMLCVALGATAVGATAKPGDKPEGTPPKHAKLDPSFGRHGSFLVSTPKGEREIPPPTHLAVAPSGKSYVQQGSRVIGFGVDGEPDRGFGENGRLVVTPKTGAVAEVAGVAVDSRGRVLVAGSIEPVPGLRENVVSGDRGPESPPDQPVTEVFAIRYLPDGSLDPTFGSGGEVNTTFGAPRPIGTASSPAEYERPSVRATHLAVDAEDRPVIAAKFVQRVETCFYKTEVNQAIVVRLNADGSLDPSFAGSGSTTIASENPIALAAAPSGAWAVLSHAESCEHGTGPAQLSVLTPDGGPLATLDPARPALRAGEAAAVDSKGRILYDEVGPLGTGRPRIARLLANGDLDASYGYGGVVNMQRLGAAHVGAVAVDNRGRLVVGFGVSQLEIGRISPSGQIENKFGKHGILHTGLGSSTQLQALAIDSKGRIIAVGSAVGGGLKTGQGVGIARFLPGK